MCKYPAADTEIFLNFSYFLCLATSKCTAFREQHKIKNLNVEINHKYLWKSVQIKNRN